MEEYEQPPGVPLNDLKVGGFVAVETCLEQHTQIFVARITRVFGANRQLEVNVYQVPTSQRYGPWNRCTWEVRTDKSDVLTHIVVPDTELLCKVVHCLGHLRPVPVLGYPQEDLEEIVLQYKQPLH